MKQSAEIDKIAPALVAALAEITDVGKSETATVPTKAGGKYTYKYATLKGVMAIIRPIFAKHKLTMMQFTRGHENGLRIEVETLALHDSGQWVADTLTVPAEAGAQGFGSAITYARRYGAQAFVGMAADEDDDAATHAADTAAEGRKWDGQVADYLAAIEVADDKDAAKAIYNDAVAKCRGKEDVGAANRIKGALLKRFPAETEKAAA